MINRLPFLLIMLICLISTIIVELLISLLLGIRNKRDILNIVLANCLTNPLVVSITNIVNVYIGYNESYIVLYILELLVVIVEGLLYKKYLIYKKINPFIISLILNLCSYLFGLLIL